MAKTDHRADSVLPQPHVRPMPHRADADLLARFNDYVSAAAEYEQLGDPDDIGCPHHQKWEEAVQRMDAAPIPETAEGAAAWLRFNLATNLTGKKEADILLNGTAADRKEYVRGKRAELGARDRGEWFALVALEGSIPDGTAALRRRYAEAWIDRWRALGGDFGRMRRDGEERLTRGMVIDLDLWNPTDRGNPDLPPHAWLIEECQHEGAVKVLEGLLALIPGLQKDVSDVIRLTVPAMEVC